MYKVSSLVLDVKNIFAISTDAWIFPRLFYLFIGAIKFVGEFRRTPKSTLCHFPFARVDLTGRYEYLAAAGRPIWKISSWEKGSVRLLNVRLLEEELLYEAATNLRRYA